MTPDIIDAFPRKKLFIDILTQDVNVSTCILDLIDNSVDSYVRSKLVERRKIEIKVQEDFFEIYDNCGGIGKDFLKEHVFKFGSEKRDIENPTLGMYGIGLKRSIFKLGNDISLETDDGVNYSYMALNVPLWEEDTINWSIPYEYESSRLQADDNPYTRISVSNLHAEIKEKFLLDPFKNDLINTIKRFYCIIIDDSIDFFLNDLPVRPSTLLVPVGGDYTPSVHQEEKDGVEIEIICFIDPSPERNTDVVNQRGWNIFCNRRLILANDTSEITGWVGKEDKSKLPKYHPTFNEFRGIVFLKSNNPFSLPLNTSKSGLNVENSIYQYVLNLMVKTARPVVDYLKSKYNRTDDDDSNNEVEQIVDENPNITYEKATEFKSNSIFSAPPRAIIENISTTVRISYSKEKEMVWKLMNYMGATTYKQVGEKTFDYYITMEGLENEE